MERSIEFLCQVHFWKSFSNDEGGKNHILFVPQKNVFYYKINYKRKCKSATLVYYVNPKIDTVKKMVLNQNFPGFIYTLNSNIEKLRNYNLSN